MYVLGISTRKVEEVAGALGVSSMSKSQVSRLCESLDSEVAAFRRQRFDGVRFAYLRLDATYVKCRVDGRSVSQAVVTAIGLDGTGHRLNRGGDRQANSAIHIIAIGRLRTDERTKEYVAKKMTEGHTKMEAIRCLKRYIAREVYYTIKKQRELVNCS